MALRDVLVQDIQQFEAEVQALLNQRQQVQQHLAQLEHRLAQLSGIIPHLKQRLEEHTDD